MKRIGVSNPYFDWCRSGVKTYEGRTANKIQDWDLYVGKHVIFYHESEEFEVEITALKRYQSFEEAFDELGHQLIPTEGITRDEVGDLYRKLPIDDPKIYGVVAIEFRVV